MNIKTATVQDLEKFIQESHLQDFQRRLNIGHEFDTTLGKNIETALTSDAAILARKKSKVSHPL